jgi:hypothetical protein
VLSQLFDWKRFIYQFLLTSRRWLGVAAILVAAAGPRNESFKNLVKIFVLVRGESLVAQLYNIALLWDKKECPFFFLCSVRPSSPLLFRHEQRNAATPLSATSAEFGWFGFGSGFGIGFTRSSSSRHPPFTH